MSPGDPPMLLFLELNEVNFDFIRAYIRAGKLPTFARLFEQHGFGRTESEKKYEELEPWIQWVTAHTGKPLAEHGVFRLGDIVNHDIPQIWEHLEEHGLRVGAVSPMNAKNRLKSPAFFVPDPWTQTPIHASRILRRLYAAVAKAVNENAQARLSAGSLFDLLIGFVRYSSAANWPSYFRYAFTARSRLWRKAMFLDLLLADVFAKEVRRTQPHFASLFVNAAAHIQHHYLFCSSVYEGPGRNPEWYVRRGEDPVLEVYELYDHLVGRTLHKFPQARLMLGTGLHQNPHPSITYYWRLRDHAEFLRSAGLVFDSVAPLMSRDFLISCGTTEAALAATRLLETLVADDGTPLFEVDNRGADLFVMLTFPRDIPVGAGFRVGDRAVPDLRSQVVFVALKNGEHDGIGYFVDSGRRLDPMASPFPLSTIPGLVFDALLGPSTSPG